MGLLRILVLGGWVLTAAPKPTAIIVTQPDSPVEIVDYSALHERENITEIIGVTHFLEFKNRGTRKVVAISFGVLSFDVFNRFMAASEGIDLQDLVPGRARRGTFSQRAHRAFTFSTGLAYVKLVRFDDGTLWQVDESAVLAEIRKIEKNFDAKLLKEKEGTSR